jgi:hypothetical protein
MNRVGRQTRAVIVPARDSNGARMEAMARYPDYAPGAISRVSRRWR